MNTPEPLELQALRGLRGDRDLADLDRAEDVAAADGVVDQHVAQLLRRLERGLHEVAKARRSRRRRSPSSVNVGGFGEPSTVVEPHMSSIAIESGATPATVMLTRQTSSRPSVPAFVKICAPATIAPTAAVSFVPSKPYSVSFGAAGVVTSSTSMRKVLPSSSGSSGAGELHHVADRRAGRQRRGERHDRTASPS